MQPTSTILASTFRSASVFSTDSRTSTAPAASPQEPAPIRTMGRALSSKARQLSSAAARLSSSLVMLFHQLSEFQDAHLGMDAIAHLHHRRQCAAPQAGHPVDLELPVWRSLALPDAQPELQRVEQCLAATHVAGRSQADVEAMSSRRGETELGVERRDPVHLTLGKPQGLRNLPGCLR